MKNAFYLVVLLFAFGAESKTACGQQNSEPTAQHQWVVAPRDLALPLIVAQPDSPLDFVETQALINVGTGRWLPGFRLRNHGTKPIRSFTVASAGTNEWSWTATISSDYFLPGQIKAIEGDNRDEIVPLTDGLRERLKLNGPMKGIMVLLVVSVEYADGSSFQEKGYEALDYYLNIVRSTVSTVPCKPRSGSQVNLAAPPASKHK